VRKRELLNGVVNRIALCGIELEGGWHEPVKYHDIRNDASVKFPVPIQKYVIDPQTLQKTLWTDPNPQPYPRYDKGEIVSEKLTVAQVETFMRLAYPQLVNETCGLHVHMSFHHKLNYSRVMSEEYMRFVIQELKTWGEQNNIPPDHMLWNRLNPDHAWTRQHCAHTFLGDKQVLSKKKDYNSRGLPHSRYTFINYPEAMLHTVECRGLPMFEKVDEAISAVMCVLTTTNRFLSRIRQREQKVPAQIVARDTSYEEIGTVVL